MNREDSVKLNAYSEIERVLDDHLAVYEIDSYTINALIIFKEYLSKLKALIAIEEAPYGWLQNQKKKSKASLLLKTLPLITAMICYANYKHDSRLRSEIDMTKSNLYYINEINLMTYVRLLIDRAKLTLNAPGKLAIHPDCIDDLEQHLNVFKSKRSELKLYLADKKNAGAEFKKNKQAMNVFLKEQLDFFIEGYRKKAPAFVNHYFAARSMGKPTYRHINVLAYVTDEATGEPISYGKVSVEELDRSTHITAKGHFRFPKFPEGKFVLKIEHLDYETLRVPIHRNASEHVKLLIKMKRLFVAKVPMQLEKSS